ncbi:MAG: hypothetical protein EWV83_24210 [Microcystis sp. M_OC_Ca_00000000_S217Cul]|nr:MAG: hypothetical protein EWV83_24210 [Microcystis sp. M_OC_Ca_00000000_S217Cul]TRT82994.1 MAG: hypothetical protein EWV66_23800 [Microcystis sp. M_OC_Ca_00000000_C217Col]
MHRTITNNHSPYSLKEQERILSREAQLFVGWVRGSVTGADVGFHASTQPTFISKNRNRF